ncbi:MAG: alpha/beta hydrolase family protein [Phocaeicola sp.]
MKQTTRILVLPLFLLAITVLGTSCLKKEKGNPAEKYLLTYTKVGSLTAEEVKSSFKELNQEVSTDEMKYGVDYYRVTFKSSYIENQELIESGLVIIPKKEGEISTVVYNHYTIFPYQVEEFIPSYFDYSKLKNKSSEERPFEEVRLFGLPFASLGKLVVMPDYSGYGESKQVEHLYAYSKALAKDSYNLLQAAYELTDLLNLQVKREVSIMGWSEGGAVSMFLQQMLEINNDKVMANYCIAGVYVPELFIELAKNIPEDYEYPRFDIMSWGALSHTIYNNIPVSTFFNEGITGAKSLIESCHKTPTLKAIFNDETRENGYAQIAELSIANNSASDWIPQAEIHLFHAEEDDWVPFIQSKAAIAEFEKSGVPEGVIIPHFYPGGDHSSTVSAMLETAIGKLKEQQPLN